MRHEPCEVVRHTGRFLASFKRSPYRIRVFAPSSYLRLDSEKAKKYIKLRRNAQLLAAEGRQDLCAEFVGPCIEEGQWARGAESGVGISCRVDFGGEGGRPRARGWISRAVTVQDVNRIYSAPLWNDGRCVGQAKRSRRKRKHGGEIAPTADHVERLASVVVCIGTDDGGLVLDCGNGGRSFDGERLVTGWNITMSVVLSVRKFRSEIKRGDELGVGPSNPTALMPGKLVSEAVMVSPGGGYWNAVVAPAYDDAL